MISAKEEPSFSGIVNVKQTWFFSKQTHSIAATENQWRNEWGAEMISCHGSSNSRGVAILFENGIDCSINHKIVEPEGRYIILKACIQDKHGQRLSAD